MRSKNIYFAMRVSGILAIIAFLFGITPAQGEEQIIEVKLEKPKDIKALDITELEDIDNTTVLSGENDKQSIRQYQRSKMDIEEPEDIDLWENESLNLTNEAKFFQKHKLKENSVEIHGGENVETQHSTSTKSLAQSELLPSSSKKIDVYRDSQLFQLKHDFDNLVRNKPFQNHDYQSQSSLEEFAKTSQIPSKTSQEINRKNWPSPVKDNRVFWFLLVDQLEVQTVDGPTTLNWDAIGWVGGDFRRFWLETEGDVGFSENNGGEAEVQALYGQLISPFWDLQAGLRYDRLYGPGPDQGRAFAVLGVQGLAPYLFEVDASLFVSEDGDVSARLTGEYDLLLTQKLVLQPSAEINLAAQRVENFGVGSGLNDIELGLRLRYEINRKLAPYVGINWQRKFFETADLAKKEGDSIGDFSVLAGVRLLF